MTPLLASLLLSSCLQGVSSQSSFSPFSILGSLFNPQPQPRPRVDRRQRQPGPGHIVFRPNLGSINGGGKTGVTGALTGAQGHKFSASQQVPSIARYNEAILSRGPPGPPPSLQQPPPSPEARLSLQRITAPSNFSFTTSSLSSSSTQLSIQSDTVTEEVIESETSTPPAFSDIEG